MYKLLGMLIVGVVVYVYFFAPAAPPPHTPGDRDVIVVRELDHGKSGAARAEVESIARAVGLYQQVETRLPDSLEALRHSGHLSGASLNDPWGRPYQLHSHAGQLMVVSVGPDGILGTDDDILSQPIPIMY